MDTRIAVSRRWFSSLASVSALLVAFTACSGKSDGGNPPATVTLSTTSVSLSAVGATQTVVAAVKDANGSTLNNTVTWTSDNVSIATVSATGSTATITAKATGTTTVRALSGSVSSTVTVQVLGVRGVQISPNAAAIRVGDAQPLTATVDADAGLAKTVVWTSESPAVVGVSAAGVVTGISVGSAIVRATSTADSRFSATAQITVSAARSIIIAPSTATIGTGQSTTLVATVQIPVGSSTAVTWRTAAPTIATVSATGVVTGVGVGTTTITAVSVADTTLRGNATITVQPVVRAVAVSPTTAALFISGTQQLTATVSADGGLALTVNWSSSNAAIATVNANGLVTAVALGSATITAASTADSTRRAAATITITARPISIAIAQRNVGINPGTTTLLVATVTADPGTNTAVTWSSSAPSVASISATGLVSGIVAGTSLITVVSQADVTKRDTVTVSVVPRLATTWTPSRLSGPLFEDVLSIVSFGPTSAFAVNLVGDVYRWNGTVWAQSLAGTFANTKFLSVQGSSAFNVIAVGTGGVIQRYDGTTWTAMTSGTTRDLASVWVESATSAFAVGTNGTALRLSGAAWTATTSGVTTSLNSVWSSGGIAYAVGAGGTVLRYSGTTWTRATVPTAETLYGVSGTTTTNVVAVGTLGTVVRFDGVTWALVSSNGVSADLFGISASTANNGRMYIASDVGLLQLDGATLTAVTTPYAPRLYAVSVDASNVIYASGQRGSVLRNAVGSWETNNLVPDLLDVWTTDANNAWAVGEFGFIFRWNGTTWTRQTAPTTVALNTVWAATASDAFAGGDDGVMLRWNGATWQSMTFPSTSSIFSLWGTSSNNVYATTQAGEVMRFNGTSWSLATFSGFPLWAVYGVSANEVYVAGENGTLLRFNGTTWTPLSPPTTGTLAGLWATGSTNIFAVGADALGSTGVSLGFNGTLWQSLVLGTARVLTSVWGPSLFDVYITGDLGTLLRFNGASWTSIATGTTDLLWSVSGAPNASGGGFAVGYNSTIVSGSNGGQLRQALSVGGANNLEPSSMAPRTSHSRGPVPAGALRRMRKTRHR